MRISDWSSDVCSSDLKPGKKTSARSAAAARALLICWRTLPYWGQFGRPLRLLWSIYDQVLSLVAFARHCCFPPDDRSSLRRARQERSEEHTSELQALMRISYAVFCLKKKK